MAALGGCGGSGAQQRHPAAASDAATVRTASCNYWRVASAEERRALVAQLRAFFGAQVDSASAPGTRGPVLEDRHAGALLQGYCRQSFAGAFKLYKIYGRAAAFTPGG